MTLWFNDCPTDAKIVGFPAKPELQKRLDEVELPEANDLKRYKDNSNNLPWSDDLPNGPSPSATILAEAIGLLEGERAKQHGDKLALHKTMAALFSAYLDVPIKPSQAAMIEALIKVARTKHGQLNADDYRDGSAYLGIAWECADAGC